MKIPSHSLKTLIPAAALVLTTACSTLSGDKSGEDLSQSGPTVVSAQVQPENIQLGEDWQVEQTPTITAEIKDFTASVDDVRLRFLRAPLEITMTQVGGTTWQANLTPEQVRMLAVGGETMKYEANIIARNEDGRIAVSQEPVTISVQAPSRGDQQAGKQDSEDEKKKKSSRQG